MTQNMAVGISGIRMLNKDTNTPVSSVFAATIYYNQITEYGFTSKGVKMVIDEGDGGTHRSLEVITQSVTASVMPTHARTHVRCTHARAHH
jgi:hypothetical protein